MLPLTTGGLIDQTTVEEDGVTSTTTDTLAKSYGRAGSGWILYATVLLGLVGIFNLIDGIVALSRSKIYVAGDRYVFSDLRTWGWIVLVLGALQLFAALYIARGSELARWFGVAAAGINAIAQLLFLPGYPLWSIAAFTMDILVVYALVVYGGARLKA
jgi:hypothetical protein